MAPPLVWLEICSSQDLETRHALAVRPPLTRRRLFAAAAKKIKGISKQSSAYNGVTGREITDEVTAAEIEGAHIVLSLTGKWEHEIPRACSPNREISASYTQELPETMENQIAGGLEFVATEKSLVSCLMNPIDQAADLTQCSSDTIDLTQCLSDELLLRLSGFLEAPSLLRTGCSCRLWLNQTLACVDLWRGLCEQLLGQTLLKVHKLAWAKSVEAPVENAMLYRRLIKAAFHCTSFTHSSPLRQHCLQQFPDFPDDADNLPDRVQQVLKHHLCVSGHTAVAFENLVVIIGGWRKRRSELDVHLYAVDISADDGPCLRQPELAASSARPQRRLRHACCVIQPNFAIPSAFKQKGILMLGGCQDQTHEPLPGLYVLNILFFTESDGSKACWREVSASGTAPCAIWHHACGSFASGKQVVVFGGDFPESDPEFEQIRDRYAASFVYVLDVDERRWERVQTRGLRPSWRSLHTGVVHTSLRDVTERLVVFGGCAEHTEIFSSGDVVDMCGYALDLQSWTWLRGPGESEFHHLPSGRMRIATERFGRFVLLYGGHGDDDGDVVADANASEALLKLDLLTLSWSHAAVSNQASDYNNCAAATLAGGVIYGGVQLKHMTVRLIPKFDFLHLEPCI